VSLYLDASTVVASLIEEPASDAVQQMLAEAADGLIVSEFAAAEVASALSRATRIGRSAPQDTAARLGVFDIWRAAETVDIDIEPADLRLASLFVRRLELALRAPDALHLALCRRGEHTLATLDRRLAQAAAELGVRVRLIA
jgi:uncharacterized protein